MGTQITFDVAIGANGVVPAICSIQSTTAKVTYALPDGNGTATEVETESNAPESAAVENTVAFQSAEGASVTVDGADVTNGPALSDMAGYKAGRAGGYPHFFRNSVDMDTPEKIKTMAYYDVVNFAKLIKVDTYMTWGFNDDVCPPTTSYIVYNVLNCPKEALITPINEHWTSNDTEYGHLLWIKKHLK